MLHTKAVDLMGHIFQVKKSTLQELMVIAFPMLISQGAFAVMIFTDRFFMSMLSPTHMAAALGGGVTTFFCMSLFIGILTYANALVAQYFGAGQRDKCSKVLTQSFLLCSVFIPSLWLIGYFVADIFGMMGHAAEQEALERTYFSILIWGAGISLCKASVASFFAGIGQTRKVMVADTLGVAINIPLSYVLIFGELGLPEMGIKGAATGTIISNLFSLCLYVYFYFEPKHRKEFQVSKSFGFDRGIMTRYIRLGFPSGLEMFLNVASFNLFILMFQSYGVAEAASAAIVLNWDILSFIPMLGLNIAVISLVGRSIGAGNIEKVKDVVASGFMLGIVYSGLLGIIFLVFHEPLVEAFIESRELQPEIFELSVFMMLGLASYVMADAILLIAGGVLRGAGDTRWLMIASVSLHWLMLCMQVVVIKVLDLGPRVSWMVFVAMVFVIAGVYLVRLRGQKWLKPEVINQVMAED